MNLVDELYKSIPEFKEINDPFFNEYDYTVFGNFGLFLEDIIQIHEYGKIIDQNYFSEVHLESTMSKLDLNFLISRSFKFIEEKYLHGDDHSKDVINTAFFKIIVTSKLLRDYAAKNMSPKLSDGMNQIWDVEPQK